MSLSSYKMHIIYLSATMNYGLGSDNPEELSYYNKIRKEMDDMKKEPIKKGKAEGTKELSNKLDSIEQKADEVYEKVKKKKKNN